MKPGGRVRHPSLGEGRVVAVYAKGGQAGAEVDFGYMAEWVSATELGEQSVDEREISQPELQIPEGGAPAAPRTLSHLPDDIVDARRGVLALKLGQVLERHVLRLSTGTEKIQADLEEVVSCAVQRQARSILIEGAWGSGKTHLLTMLSAIAAASGMATSSVILDGGGVALSEPMSLMEAFLSSLRYPGEPAPCGINRRLSQLRRSEARWELFHRGGERIADAIWEVPMSAFDEPEVVQVLEDYFTLNAPATQANLMLSRLGYWRVRLPPMKARRVDERPVRFCELLQGWTEFVALTGAKGLVLIIDEVDVEYASTIWSAEARRRRSNLLRALRKCLKTRLPLVVAFGGAPASGDVAARDDAVRDLAKRSGGFDLEIEAPQPNLQQTRELARRVHALYALAYPERMIKIDRDGLKKLLDAFAESHLKTISPVPRNFVRGTLERLDVVPNLSDYEARA